jgi:glucose-6-phosphate isomerase
VSLSIHHDLPESESCFARFKSASVLGGLKALDSRARRKGLASLDPSRGALIPIGMEVERDRVVGNRYGVFNLAWQSENHPEWPEQIAREIDEIRVGIREAHGAPLQYAIWAGMGGSAEDKAMYQALGLLRRGPRVYLLDSTDPAKLCAIVADIKRRSGLSERDMWKRTLVIAMAMGMTSYEPVSNLEKLASYYDGVKLDSRPNIYYLTLPGSLLDKFAKPRGYRGIPLQLDGANSTCGRHSGPLTRGSLYPLALAGVDVTKWIAGASLSSDEVHTAWRLASFLHTQGVAGRNKVTLLLPRAWNGAGVWTKQDFEESLGKSAEHGMKIVTGERVRMNHFHAPRDARQDRVFLGIDVKGATGGQAMKLAMLRRAGYPVAVVSLAGAPLSHYMQFIHYVVFGVAWLRKVNFVTQPNVELYKSIAHRLHTESLRGGISKSGTAKAAKTTGIARSGIASTREWRRFVDTERSAVWRGCVTLRWDRLAESEPVGSERMGSASTPCGPRGATAPALYAWLLRRFTSDSPSGDRPCDYGELTFFGDMRYSARGRAMRAALDRAAESTFRAACKIPVDVYEGPAMNHSYHEMIIGYGKCFSTILLAEPDQAADYHCAQFLATQMALAERGRAVVSITLRDLGEASLRALDEFFRQAATHLRASKSPPVRALKWKAETI